VEYTQRLLEEIGLEAQRVRMVNMSSAMGAQFAEAVTQITEEIRELGPSRLKAGV